MKYIPRLIEHEIQRALARGKSVLLFGARQTGKTTLIRKIPHDRYISFAQPEHRQRYEAKPSLLLSEVRDAAKQQKKLLILLDEIQMVPQIMDVVQSIIDDRLASFVLTGSSARKLKTGSHVNLLPGRVVSLRLDPFSLKEHLSASLDSSLLFGALPGILGTVTGRDKELDLESYVTTYLEEEVRREALVRNLGSFVRFLELAASESGNTVNFMKLSQEIGVAHTTIQSYYEILEDCLIAERIEPLTRSSVRKKLTKSHKILFFDMGVRRAAAKEGTKLPREIMGRLFEQFVGLELVRQARSSRNNTRVRFWRDPDGPEVDWILESGDSFIPIEVKLSSAPNTRDAHHLSVFLKEYRNAPQGYVVCQTPERFELAKNITAIPWQQIPMLFSQAH